MDNLTLFYLIFGLTNKNVFLDYLMIFGAQYLIYVMLILMFILTIKGKVVERKSFILFLIAFPVSVLAIKIIHLFFFEPRPYITNNILPLIQQSNADASFPSRHVAIAFIMALSYFYYKSKWVTILLLLAAWVGISRVYVGVHYPLDIVGGIAVGIISLAVAWKIKNYLGKKLLAT